MRILFAIHDFLPRHHAGSEIYALELARALSARHDVTILCAEYDPSRQHGHVTWRAYEGIPVIEVVNNWVCSTFSETYRSPLITGRIEQVLDAVQPDVVHVHNLMNLSFDLPAAGRRRGIPIVATLHDYGLVCPSGGQRIHQKEQHVCHVIDTERCARCFRESPFHSQISFGRLATAARAPLTLRRAAVRMFGRFPGLAGRVRRTAARVPHFAASPADFDRRLADARRVFEDIDLFVAPSPSIAAEFERLGLGAGKIRISDYGFVPLLRPPRPARRGPLRIGFVGTLVWHKGVHVLLDAVRGLPAGGYELRIFGDTKVFPEYSAALEKGAAGLPVSFMGPFDRGRVADVYAQMDVLVVPSLWLENSPLVIHEAFMAGIPVVGARMGGIADLVEDGRTGLLYDATSPSELESALRSLIDHPEQLQSLAALARSVPQVKSIAQDAAEWDRTYSDQLGRRTVSGPAA